MRISVITIGLLAVYFMMRPCGADAQLPAACTTVQSIPAAPPTSGTVGKLVFAGGVYLYSLKGSVICDSYDTFGNGVYTSISSSNAFWINNTSTDGPFNRCAVWAATLKDNQDVGFSVCVDIPADKEYYLGFGIDNYATVKVDSKVLLKTGAVDPVQYWMIYKLALTRGKHFVEVLGTNVSGPGAIGFEIYDNTKAEIASATSYNDLNLIFSTKDEVGKLIQEGDPELTYSCPEGYSMDYCSGAVPLCSKIVTTVLTPTVTVSTPVTSVCTGMPVTFTANITNGGANPTFQWLVNGQPVGINSSTFKLNSPVDGDDITCNIISSELCTLQPAASGNHIILSVLPVVKPSVTITASPNNICSGAPVTFTAATVDAGNPFYKLRVNGGDAGNSTAVFTSSNLKEGDIISCTIIANAACMVSPVANSNNIVLHVTPTLTPKVDITVSADSICAGTPLVFNAAAANAGTAPGYQWKVNGTNAGTNSPAFTTGTAANGDKVMCIVTSNAACSTKPADTSNVIVLNVVEVVTPSVSISTPLTNICSGVPVTFTAASVNAGNPIYKWKVNGNSAGSGTNVFASNNLQDGDVISCLIVATAACSTSPVANSNNIVMHVTASVTPKVDITASGDSICAGTTVVFNAVAVNTGATPNYQWQINNNNTGTNSAGFTTANPVNGDKVMCIITTNVACAAKPVDTSNVIVLKVSDAVTPSLSIAASATNICAGVNVVFTATATNGGATPAYQWLLNSNNVGANNAVYSSSLLQNGDVVNCVLTGSAACSTKLADTANTIAVNVTQPSTPAITVNNTADSVCAGTDISFSATAVDAGASPQYQWLVNRLDVGARGATFNSSRLSNGDMVSCSVTSSDACAVIQAVSSVPIAVTIYPLPVVDAGPFKLITQGSTTTLDGQVTGNIQSILWSPAVGLSNTGILQPVSSTTSTTLYTLRVETVDGCNGTDTVTVKVLPRDIFIPNVFSPNGDGINDVWQIEHLADYPDCVVSVFNRYGQRVFNSTGYTVPWNGTTNSKPMAIGTYYYIINITRGMKPKTGYIVIVR